MLHNNIRSLIIIQMHCEWYFVMCTNVGGMADSIIINLVLCYIGHQAYPKPTMIDFVHFRCWWYGYQLTSNPFSHITRIIC